jgi:hypothetical protein
MKTKSMLSYFDSDDKKNLALTSRYIKTEECKSDRIKELIYECKVEETKTSKGKCDQNRESEAYEFSANSGFDKLGANDIRYLFASQG